MVNPLIDKFLKVSLRQNKLLIKDGKPQFSTQNVYLQKIKLEKNNERILQDI
jgi:hypothetical protein